ncbi:hypothetical protein AB9T88_12195, partial [Flavobacterium sp. LBUM151]
GDLINDAAYFGLANDSTSDISKYFKIGDELIVNQTKLWVTGYKSNTDKSKIQLMDSSGNTIDASTMPASLHFKIIRSGNKNLQTASMAAVTSMTNPIANNQNITNATFGYMAGSTFDKKVINASAIEYSDDWKSQCENGLPNEAGLITDTGVKVNPYLYNTKGNWRAIKSYAYLTGRNNHSSTNRRKTGYFISFNPFYQLNADVWSKDLTNWTFASEVTKYSPYGTELENKDALDRYSSAQYGYNYTLPIAVASNAKYSEIGFDGFDGFEDYGVPNPVLDALLKPHFGFSQAVNTNVKVSNAISHTGNNSIAINPGQKANFIRKINGCKAAPTVPVTSYPFQFSNSGSTTTLACSQTIFPLTFYAATTTLSVNTQLYLNPNLTIPVIGENLWYQLGTNKTPYRVDSNGKITESYYCSSGGGSTPTSLIGFTIGGITDHSTPYADGGNFIWSNFYADIYLNTAGANLNIGDTLTIEYQVRSTFATLHYYSVQYPNNSAEDFSPLGIYAVVNKTITYDGVNNVVRVNLAIPLSKIQTAKVEVPASIKLVKINGITTTFKPGASSINIITPASGGIIHTLN